MVSSDLSEPLDIVEATYSAFRVAGSGADPRGAGAEPAGAGLAAFGLTDLGEGGPCLLETAEGRVERLADPGQGTIALLEALVGTVVAGLHRDGLYAVHAGAAAGPHGAVIVAGRSGQGKSTLVLGLVRRGLALLSDELALLDPEAGLVHAYPRAVHVRPDTTRLIPELAALEGRPRHELGGGSEWSVTAAEVAALLGGRVTDAAPPAAVVLLDGTPDPTAAPRIRDEFPAVATLELLRSTWATSADFAGTLEAVGGMLSGVPCVRLSVGQFDRTIDTLLAHLERGDG